MRSLRIHRTIPLIPRELRLDLLSIPLRYTTLRHRDRLALLIGQRIKLGDRQITQLTHTTSKNIDPVSSVIPSIIQPDTTRVQRFTCRGLNRRSHEPALIPTANDAHIIRAS